ncbi:unnamed protein product [Caenorhabditis auriculariae]|uniref:Globin domain-containing protein n=1 Tax=Caenorhabditis auriculariae TaxID=2777116 RepID=A0A8S1H9Z1_9PELO|nr:unnamed protein product [Caenorhabditis auriculariae]
MASSDRRRSKYDRSYSVQEEGLKVGLAGPAGLSRKSRPCSRSKSTRRGQLGTVSSLTYSQKQALTLSWRLMRTQAASCFRKVLLELEIASPKVKQIFYKAALVDAFNKDEDNSATMEAHIRLVIKFFDDILSTLDDDDECLKKMRAIGSSHAVLARSCNFSGDIFERLGEITMERICSHENVQKTREAARAWRILIAIIIDELRSGFDGEARQHRKCSSSDQIDNSPCEEEDDLHLKVRQLRVDFDSSFQT